MLARAKGAVRQPRQLPGARPGGGLQQDEGGDAGGHGAGTQAHHVARRHLPADIRGRQVLSQRAARRAQPRRLQAARPAAQLRQAHAPAQAPAAAAAAADRAVGARLAPPRHGLHGQGPDVRRGAQVRRRHHGDLLRAVLQGRRPVARALHRLHPRRHLIGADEGRHGGRGRGLDGRGTGRGRQHGRHGEALCRPRRQSSAPPFAARLGQGVAGCHDAARGGCVWRGGRVVPA
mmetsp:Transcript_16145/g.56319  ORF Transcript_16145/g.56319 Transcript_16145/m.56319 type:complete len:233 (-) Transcript_16145:364-1062(-)